MTETAVPVALPTRVLQVARTPRGGIGPRWSTYEVPVGTRRTTVLDALTWARHHLDASLDVRHSCFHGSCGTCGMRVNGREALACVTALADVPGSAVVVEPLASFDVVSDLVVDLEALYAALDEVGRPLVRADERAPVNGGAAGSAVRFEDCLECGLCVSACPIAELDPAYLGPAALASAWRVVREPRDADVDDAMDIADGDQGAWRCHLAFECSAACPVDERPGEAIMHLRGALLRHRHGAPTSRASADTVAAR